MHLSYRGIEFETQVSTSTTHALGVSGKYRGHEVAFRAPHSTTINSAIALTYRGRTYLR